MNSKVINWREATHAIILSPAVFKIRFLTRRGYESPHALTLPSLTAPAAAPPARESCSPTAMADAASIMPPSVTPTAVPISCACVKAGVGPVVAFTGAYPSKEM